MNDPKNDECCDRPGTLRTEWANRVHSARDQMVEQGKKVAERADTEVHRHPWMYIGIGALFSLVLGFLLGRKSRSGRD